MKPYPAVPLRFFPPLTILILCALSSALIAQPSDRQHIERLLAKYMKSVESADTALAAEVWSQSADVSFIHPLGHEHGFSQIK